MSKLTRVITISDLANMTGATPGQVSNEVKRTVAGRDWRYRNCTQEEQEQIIAEALSLDIAPVIDPIKNQAHWQTRWTESKGSCIKPGNFMRWRGTYIWTYATSFESYWYRVFFRQIIHQWLKSPDSIYEFGSGSGINLPSLAIAYPDAQIWGLDWAQSSIDRTNKLGERYPNVIGQLFNMLEPDLNLKLPARSAVITVGAVEQLGARFRPFLAYLIAQRPAICIHLEPIVEFYDPTSPADQAAIHYHRKRGLLEGYLPALQADSRVEILRAYRTGVGSKFIEGYSQLIWRPV